MDVETNARLFTIGAFTRRLQLGRSCTEKVVQPTELPLMLEQFSIRSTMLGNEMNDIQTPQSVKLKKVKVFLRFLCRQLLSVVRVTTHYKNRPVSS